MNSHYIWKCPQRDKHTEIELKDGIIHINCQCGYQSTISIKECIKDCKRDKKENTIKDNTFKEITTDIEQANEHLLTYFKEIKEEHISRLMELMSKLKTAYEESYKRNKDILTFLEILIDNYDGSNEMKKNID